MVTKTTKAEKRQRVAPGPAALVLCLALLTSGCASGTSNLFDSLDSNNDNTLSRDEWNRGFDKIDTSGDGAITSQEFSAAAGGGSPAGGGGGAAWAAEAWGAAATEAEATSTRSQISDPWGEALGGSWSTAIETNGGQHRFASRAITP